MYKWPVPLPKTDITPTLLLPLRISDSTATGDLQANSNSMNLH